jgi:competence protein ComEC
MRPLWGAAPHGGFVLVTQVRQWAAQEVAAGRLLPWLVVAYGLGIVIYFTAGHEPVWQVAAGTAIACAFGAFLLRRRLTAFVVALFITSIACGFAVATIKTASIAHPILRYNGIMAQTPQEFKRARRIFRGCRSKHSEPER